MSNYTFAEPLWFILLILPILLWILMMRRERRGGGLGFSSLRLFGNRSTSKKWVWLGRVPNILRVLALVLMVFALARPFPSQSKEPRSTEGLDIVLVVDTSGSMKAQDFLIGNKRPMRLEVVKEVMKEFVASRSDDRIGVVVFGTEAFTHAPLTLDHEALDEFIDRIEIGLAGEATAIGDGIAVASKRLKDLASKDKVIILLTDGASNAGRVDPMSAAEAAKALGIRVYTIGVGSDGEVPIQDGGRVFYVRVDIDEKMMRAISDLTGAQYFRAMDTDSLKNIYKTIDTLEKNKVKVKHARRIDERYEIFIWLALLFLFLECVWLTSKWRRIPT